jgi:hypothetical protein
MYSIVKQRYNSTAGWFECIWLLNNAVSIAEVFSFDLR